MWLAFEFPTAQAPNHRERLMKHEPPDGWNPLTDAQIKFSRAKILDALDRAPLECYYDIRGNFTGTSFVDLAPNYAHKVTATDLHAVAMLAVSIEPAATRRLLSETPVRKTMLEALGKVPEDVTLANASNAQLEAGWRFHGATLAALSEPRATNSKKWVTAAKLTARKRPLLIPVRDEKVTKSLGDVFWEDGRAYWLVMRELTSDPHVVAAARSAVAAAKARAASRVLETKFETNTLRLIDVAVWMSAAGYARTDSHKCAKANRVAGRAWMDSGTGR